MGTCKNCSGEAFPFSLGPSGCASCTHWLFSDLHLLCFRVSQAGAPASPVVPVRGSSTEGPSAAYPPQRVESAPGRPGAHVCQRDFPSVNSLERS